MVMGRLHQWWNNKNIRLTIVATALLLAALFVWLGIFFVSRNQLTLQSPVTNSPVAADYKPTDSLHEPIETKLPRRLDGVLVDKTLVNKYPVAFMIENAAFGGVRPQFGLNAAQVIYEIVVEGGITRFMAVYSGDFPEQIGPVRSARPTYLDFASEYNALYGHAGGSPEALQSISGMKLPDLSALGTDARFFKRDTMRAAPHNLFSYNNLLAFVRRDKNLPDDSATYESWSFKEDTKPSTEPTPEKNVNIDFGSSVLYSVHYVYNYVANNYERWNGGELQHDANDNSILTTKNVVIQIVPSAINAGNKGRVNFSVTGEGKVYIVRDGGVVEGIWKKADQVGRTQFYDTTGKIIALNRGTTWVEIVPAGGKVTYN